MLCSQVQLVKPGPGFEDIKPLPCRSWNCDYCAPARRRQLIAQAASGEPNKVLTLTVSTSVGNSPLERRHMLHDAWKRLVKRILRRFGWKHLDYMAFVEKTKRGEPHLHILLRCPFIPQRWISEQMAQMIGSPICWIEKVNNTRAAVRYVTKYVAKAPAQFGTTKRYWLSRGWEVNQGDRQTREPFDMAGTHVRRERWSETEFKLAWRRNPQTLLADGWIRVFAQGTAWEAWGSDPDPDDST